MHGRARRHQDWTPRDAIGATINTQPDAASAIARRRQLRELVDDTRAQSRREQVNQGDGPFPTGNSSDRAAAAAERRRRFRIKRNGQSLGRQTTSTGRPNSEIMQRAVRCLGRATSPDMWVSGCGSRPVLWGGLGTGDAVTLGSSFKSDDAVEVGGSINRAGVTDSGPSVRIDSYHPDETSQVRQRHSAPRFAACPVDVRRISVVVATVSISGRSVR